jgi:hypothetical protein
VNHAPHPDVAAIKNAVESNSNYDLKIVSAKEFNGIATGYNLVILHQLPSALYNVNEWFEKWGSDGVSVWVILGAATNINFLNSLNTGLQVSNSNGSLNEVQAIVSPGFSLFTTSDEFRNAVTQWPPLAAPFGIYKLKSNASSLLTQRVRNIVTEQPLLFFRQDNNRRIAVLSAEGIWKWRLAEFEEKGNSNIYDELITRIVQYLSAEQNLSPFRVQGKNSYLENEPLIFDAELLDESGTMINTPEDNYQPQWQAVYFYLQQE